MFQFLVATVVPTPLVPNWKVRSLQALLESTYTVQGRQEVIFVQAEVVSVFHTVLSGVQAADGGWRAAAGVGHREGVCQALSGRRGCRVDHVHSHVT